MLPAVTNQGGQSMAFPDVCLTPTPAGPVPIPYPNICMCPTMNAGTAPRKVFVGKMKPAVLMTTYMTSTGDEAGNAPGGVMSGMFKGPGKHLMGSTKVILEGKPAAYLTSMVGHNGVSPNAPPGLTVAPSQTTVLLSP